MRYIFFLLLLLIFFTGCNTNLQEHTQNNTSLDQTIDYDCQVADWLNSKEYFDEIFYCDENLTEAYDYSILPYSISPSSIPEFSTLNFTLSNYSYEFTDVSIFLASLFEGIVYYVHIEPELYPEQGDGGPDAGPSEVIDCSKDWEDVCWEYYVNIVNSQSNETEHDSVDSISITNDWMVCNNNSDCIPAWTSFCGYSCPVTAINKNYQSDFVDWVYENYNSPDACLAVIAFCTSTYSVSCNSETKECELWKLS